MTAASRRHTRRGTGMSRSAGGRPRSRGQSVLRLRSQESSPGATRRSTGLFITSDSMASRAGLSLRACVQHAVACFSNFDLKSSGISRRLSVANQRPVASASELCLREQRRRMSCPVASCSLHQLLLCSFRQTAPSAATPFATVSRSGHPVKHLSATAASRQRLHPAAIVCKRVWTSWVESQGRKRALRWLDRCADE